MSKNLEAAYAQLSATLLAPNGSRKGGLTRPLERVGD